jgi:hypothetical protein
MARGVLLLLFFAIFVIPIVFMKKILFIILGGALFAGCKEKAPTIVLEKKAVVDSAYTLTTVPATDPHYVLVEEFTGQSCSNCPAAHVKLEEIKAHYNDRVIVMGLYKFNIGQTTPPHEAIYDFRDSSATLIADQIYNGVNQLPSAGVDRVPVGGSLKLNQSDWDPTVGSRSGMVDSLNLKIASSYNAADDEYVITANVVYTQKVTIPQNLTIAILEDSLVDKQDYPYGSIYPNDVNPAYGFTNVFRAMVSSAPSGDAILATATEKKPGMGLQRKYIYKLKPGTVVNPANCRVVAFVSNAVAGNNQIAQAAETKLKP